MVLGEVEGFRVTASLLAAKSAEAYQIVPCSKLCDCEQIACKGPISLHHLKFHDWTTTTNIYIYIYIYIYILYMYVCVCVCSWSSSIAEQIYSAKTKHINIRDQSLKFDKQINAVISSCFLQLRLLSQIKYFLSVKTLEIAIHALITSHLDCNSLFWHF